MNRRT